MREPEKALALRKQTEDELRRLNAELKRDYEFGPVISKIQFIAPGRH